MSKLGMYYECVFNYNKTLATSEVDVSIVTEL